MAPVPCVYKTKSSSFRQNQPVAHSHKAFFDVRVQFFHFGFFPGTFFAFIHLLHQVQSLFVDFFHADRGRKTFPELLQVIFLFVVLRAGIRANLAPQVAAIGLGLPPRIEKLALLGHGVSDLSKT